LKRDSRKLSISTGKRGDAVILTIMVLLILFIFTASMLFMFTSWQKSASKMLSGRNAYRFARAGIEEAIWEIDKDSLEEDSFLDSWRANFKGEDTDLNEDGIPDARWFDIKKRNGEITGRYAVLVEDESGKININHAGNTETEITYTVRDMKILPHIIGEAAACSIVDYRQTREYEAPSEVKLVKNIGEDAYSKIKNHITCFSYDMNHDRKGKQRININDSSFGEMYALLTDCGYSREIASQVALNIKAYRNRSLAPPVIDLEGEEIIGIGKTPYLNEIDAVKPWHIGTLASGTIIISEQGGQFVELFNPYGRELDIGGWQIKGIVTLFSESWSDVLNNSSDILDDISRGETGIEPGRTRQITERLVPTSITIPEGEKIPPLSFYTIGDSIELRIVIIPGEPPVIFPLFIPIRDPADCNHYEPILAINPGSLGFISNMLSSIPFLANLGLDFKMKLLDSEGNLVENTTYFADLPHTTVQKNDPRMKDCTDWFPGTQTPGKHNMVFQPWIGGEFGNTDWISNWPSHFNIRNSKFLSLGELSLIHRKRHWKTLDFWKHGYDRKLIDHFTVFENPKEPAFGRLNINTSCETVLACLPKVNGSIAKAIVNAGPYGDISEVLGKWGAGSSPSELLSREITSRGFDLNDNDRDGYIDTDKEKEEVFSGIVNLITVRSNVFKIISIGQKVRDTEKNGKIERDVLAEKKVVVWYDRRKKKVIYRREIQ